jgi:hypothetical protein
MFLVWVEKDQPGSVNLSLQLHRQITVRRAKLLAQKRKLPIRRLFNHFRIILEASDSQQAIMIGRLILWWYP